MSAAPLPEGWFRREDETPDHLFYLEPRLVTHIDDEAIAALGQFLGEHVPPGAEVLDLMSSCVSHLPPATAQACKRVVGLGMNAVELEANPQLTERLVHDLNRRPVLPFPDASFDVALCTVSVQYLLHPVEVFAEVGRVLRPGGPFFVFFSNRCFPTKAVAVWLGTDDAEHAALVGLYFDRSGGWRDLTRRNLSPFPPGHSDPLYVVYATRAGTP